MSDKRELLQAIAKEETLLTKLNSEREEALTRLNAFKQRLAEIETTCAEPSTTYVARTPKEKVALFRSFFRGREDLFPKL